MKLEHFGMAEPGDCRLVFTADAEELERAITAEQAAPDAPQAEEDLLTAAVNRTILEGFSALYEQIAAEYGVTPVTDPDFELLAVNRAEGFRAGAQFYALPPLTLGRYTGFVQAVEPHLIRQLTIEMEINRHHGDEERAADAAGKAALRQQVARELYAQRCVQAKARAEKEVIWQLGDERFARGVPCKKGLKELLAALEDMGLPRIVASSSPRNMIEMNLQTTGTARYFHDVVSGTEVAHSKPAPDTFLVAAKKLHLDPHDCLVLEDSFNGVRAGRAAGCVTVMVPDLMQPTEEIAQLYDRKCEDLLEVRDLLIEGKL